MEEIGWAPGMGELNDMPRYDDMPKVTVDTPPKGLLADVSRAGSGGKGWWADGVVQFRG